MSFLSYFPHSTAAWCCVKLGDRPIPPLDQATKEQTSVLRWVFASSTHLSIAAPSLERKGTNLIQSSILVLQLSESVRPSLKLPVPPKNHTGQLRNVFFQHSRHAQQKLSFYAVLKQGFAMLTSTLKLSNLNICITVAACYKTKGQSQCLLSCKEMAFK